MLLDKVFHKLLNKPHRQNILNEIKVYNTSFYTESMNDHFIIFIMRYGFAQEFFASDKNGVKYYYVNCGIIHKILKQVYLNEKI